MEKIKMISHNTVDGLDGIKTASLYFDKIEIPNYYQLFVQATLNPETKEVVKTFLKGKQHFIEDSFEEHLQPLIEAGIINLFLEYLPHEESTIDPITKQKFISLSSNKQLSEAISENLHHIFKIKKIDKNELKNGIEIPQVFNEEVPKFITSIDNDGAGLFALKYYSLLAETILNNTSSGQQCLTTSSAVNNIIQSYYNSVKFRDAYDSISKEISVNPAIILETINLNIPNLSKLSFYDILELREKMSEELQAFKVYMKNFQLELQQNYDERFITLKSKELVKTKINPALNDLIRKLNGLNANIPVKILQEIKDPKSYSPLLLTFSNNIATGYAVLISLGLMSVSTAMDYINTKKEIKANGLYYLLKLKNG